MKNNSYTKRSGIARKALQSLLALMLMSGLVSCEDFLDRPARGNLAEDDFYKTVSHAQMAVYGAYRTMAARALFGEKITVFYHMETDETRIPSSSSNTNDWRSIARYGQNASNPDIKNLYANLYQLVEKANDCIDNIPKMAIWINGNGFETTDPSSDIKALRRLYAEAVCIRALAYNNLINFFGDVPFKMHSSVTGEDFDMARASRDVIYDFLIEDIEKNLDWLPWRGEVTAEERFDKGSAKALLARIALHAAGVSLRWDLETYDPASVQNSTRPDAATRNPELYEIARTHTRDIIQSGQHSLNPDFRDVFYQLVNSQIDWKYGERMFEIGIYESLQGGGCIASYSSPKIAYSADNNFGEGKGYLQVLPGFYYSYHPDDQRMEVTNTPFNIDNDGKIIVAKLNACYAGKFRRWWNTAPAKSRNYTDVNWCVIRYSDVLLMYAEADWWLSNGGNVNGTSVSADALEAFNMVRRRGFGQEIYAASPYDLNHLTFEDIVDERSFELAHEGIRKWDLLRWGILGERLQKAREDMQAIRDNTFAPRHNPDAYGAISDYIYYQVAAGMGIDPDVSFQNQSGWTRVDWRRAVSESDVNMNNDPSRRGVGRYWTSLRSELLPIPQTVLDNRKNLKQTPPYAAFAGIDTED